EVEPKAAFSRAASEASCGRPRGWRRVGREVSREGGSVSRGQGRVTRAELQPIPEPEKRSGTGDTYTSSPPHCRAPQNVSCTQGSRNRWALCAPPRRKRTVIPDSAAGVVAAGSRGPRGKEYLWLTNSLIPWWTEVNYTTGDCPRHLPRRGVFLGT